MTTFLRFIFGLLIVAMIVFFSALFFERYLAEETLDITVSKIEKAATENGDRYYLVYTKQEVFYNRDHYFHHKSNANELNSKMEPKGKYRVKVVGFNFGTKLPLFLDRRNILEIVEQKSFYPTPNSK